MTQENLTPDQMELQSQRAKQLLKDPVLRAAFDQLGRQYFDAWKIEPDRDKRDNLWHRFTCLEEVLGQLEVIATNWAMSTKHKNLRQKPK